MGGFKRNGIIPIFCPSHEINKTKTSEDQNKQTENRRRGDLNRCHLTRGHFSWALLKGSFLLVQRTFQQKALQEQDSPQPCGDQRPSSSGDSRMAGDAHCAVTLLELLCRNGAQSFRWAKGTAWKHPLPRQEQSDCRGFPAFGRILLDGSRPLSGMGNFYCAAPSLLRVRMQIATPCCILMTKWAYFSCKLLLLWEGMRAGCNSASVSHWRGVFGEVKKLWTQLLLKSCGTGAGKAGFPCNREMWIFPFANLFPNAF